MGEDKSKTGFPMMPESNWWNIRNQFNKTLPSNVSVNYLKTLLALTTDQAAKNIISPLKALSLINEDGSPTERANEWRNDSTYAEACEAMLKEVYPKELLDLFPEKDFDKQKAKEWFKSTGKLGESAAQKAVSLFAILKMQEVKKDLGIASQTSKTAKVTSKTKAKLPTVKEKSIEIETVVQSPVALQNPIPRAKEQHNALTMHIDLQIHISPEASAEQIDSIFASMAKHLYK